MGWNTLKSVTVEPVLFLQMAGDTLTFVIFQNLFIEKICTNLNYDAERCFNYTQAKDEVIGKRELGEMEKNIQGQSSTFLLYNSLVENSLPLFLVLLLGIWSDANRRRKPPLLLSLTGKMLRSLGLLINAYFIKWPPIILLLSAALPLSLGGGNAVFHMAAFSYLGDVSVPRNRTWRLGIAEAFWQLGTPVGIFLGAYLFERGGYLIVFATSFSFHLIGVLYILFVLPEVPKPGQSQYYFNVQKSGYGTMARDPLYPEYKRIRCHSEQINDISAIKNALASQNKNESHTEGNNNSAQQYQDSEIVFTGRGDELSLITSGQETGSGVSIFAFVAGSLKAIVKKRPNHTRKSLIALGFIMLLYGIAYHGEANIKYLFTRNKFGWREQEFSLWAIYESIILVVGLSCIMPIFSKVLKLNDTLSGSIAALARTASKIFISLAPKGAYLFYGTTIDLAGVIGPLSTRSLASKCVLRDERGKVFAVLGCIEALVPLIAVPLYSVIYYNTLSYEPSAIFFVSIGIYMSIFLIFCTLYIAEKYGIIFFNGNDLSSLLRSSNSPDEYYRRTSLS